MEGVPIIDRNQLLVIYGCGGHARTLANTQLLNDPTSQILFVDGNAQNGETIFGFPAIKELPALENYQYILGIGNTQMRKTKYEVMDRKKLTTIVAKSAELGYFARVGLGCLIGRLCLIGPEVIIGENTHICGASLVGHGSSIGQHCTIAAHVTVSGNVKIGDAVTIGAGTTIIDKITICSNAVIGAGATVIRDILEPGTYVGTPAKRIK